MTREETKGLIRVIMSIYPNFRPTNLSETVDAWSFILAEQDKADVAQALKEYAVSDKSGFAPSPGQLCNEKKDKRREYYKHYGMEELYEPIDFKAIGIFLPERTGE